MVELSQLDLGALRKAQERTLKERNNEMFHEKKGILKSLRERRDAAALLSVHPLRCRAGQSENELHTPGNLWKNMVERALAWDLGFFTTDAARMKEISRCVSKGMAAYSGFS